MAYTQYDKEAMRAAQEEQIAQLKAKIEQLTPDQAAGALMIATHVNATFKEAGYKALCRYLRTDGISDLTAKIK